MKPFPGIKAEQAAARFRAIARLQPTAKEAAKRLRCFGEALNKIKIKQRRHG